MAASVGVWAWWLDAPGAVPEHLMDLLSPEERSAVVRRERVVNGAVAAGEPALYLPARRYALAHARLRQILGHATGSEPSRLAFVNGEHGKPALAGPGPHFNLTHSGAMAAVALAPFEVGLDLEEVRSLGGRMPVRYLSGPERSRIAAVPPERRERAFLACWARKEAVLKATGAGLSVRLSSFSVGVDEGGGPVLEWMDGDPAAAQAWQIADVDLGPSCVAAVAARRRGWDVHCHPVLDVGARDWPEEDGPRP